MPTPPHESRPAERSSRDDEAVSIRDFEQSPGFIIVMRGPEHTVRFVNASARALFGAQEWTGRVIRQAIPSADGQGFFDRLDEVYRTGRAFEARAMPIRYVRDAAAGPEERFLDFVYTPIIDDGTVTGIFCEGFDVTDAVRAQKAAERHRARLESLNEDLEREVRRRTRARERGWDVTPDLMGAMDLEGRFETSNPAWARLLGWSAEEIRAEPFLDFLHPEDRERSRKSFERVLAGEPTIRLDNRYRTKSGDYRWISWIAVLEDGHVHCTGRDVTVEKMRAETLRARQQERDELWCSSRDLFVTISTEGLYREVNPSWERVLGWNEQELIGTAFDALVHPDEVDEVRERFAGILAGTSVHDFGIRVRAKDSSYRMIEWTAGVSGETVFCSGRDVTERIEKEAELQRAAAALHQSRKLETIGQLTGGVAHDFNNLLMAVGSSLVLLRDRLPADDERSRALLDDALEGAERGASLTQRMLAFARRQDLAPVPVDVGALLGGMSTLLARSLGPEVIVETSVAEAVPKALVDPNQLELAVLNLAVNARDAMGDGGRLRLSVDRVGSGEPDGDDERAGPFVRLCVTDEGVGMDAATLAKAAEPFFTTKEVGAGTGLGLSMVQGLSEQTGGRFGLTSVPGQGTTAEILLPMAPAANRPMHDPAAPLSAVAPRRSADEADRLRVLVVDDDALVLSGIAGMLRALGHEAEPTSSGADALRALDAGATFDVVMTDHAMPGMTGLELARRIKARWPTLPVVLASGYAELPAGVGESIDGRLAKPFRAQRLVEVLRAICACDT